MTESYDNLPDEVFLGQCYIDILNRNIDAQGKAHYLKELKKGKTCLSVIQTLINCGEFKQAQKTTRIYSDGHFPPPLNSPEEIEKFSSFNWNPPDIPGVILNDDAQYELLQSFIPLYDSLPFADHKQKNLRYQFVNPSYSYGDGIFLYCMIRHLNPKRIIEIGAGNSSCLILDTNELFFNGSIVCSFIEPYPEYFISLLRPDDIATIKLIPERLQDLDLTIFEQLEAQDILFIDSTHVSKLNSDVNKYVFEILPSLKKGVSVHIHDVFHPFEYPLEWLREGRSWNEQYVIRAFLQYNNAFSIKLFTTHMIKKHYSWFEEKMPKCLKSTGGSLWLEKAG